MKTYLKIVATFALLVFTLVVAGPWLISARSTEAVIAGFVLLALLMPITIYLVWRRDINDIVGKLKNEGEKS